MRNRFLLMNLPTNVIVEILARLPARTIAACKSVCKTWLDLIASPYFISLHSSLSRPALIIHHYEIFKTYFKLIDFDDSSQGSHRLSPETATRLDFSGLSCFPDAKIVIDGSANGFLFLRDVNYKHESLYVCNPLTRECFELPNPDGLVRYPMAVTHGFGFSRKTGEYKVVRISQDRELNPRNGICMRVLSSVCQVYGFQSRAWRSVPESLARFTYDSRLVGTFLHGNIHWLVHDLEGFELISCFDLEDERFVRFPGPFMGRRILGSLGLLRGCLALCDNTDDRNINVWVMREYGVERSWAKEVVIEKMPDLVGPSFQIVYVLEGFEDGSLLMVWGDFFMLYYCGRRKVVEGVDLCQPRGPNSIEAIHHVPSFLTLGSFVSENVRVY